MSFIRWSGIEILAEIPSKRSLIHIFVGLRKKIRRVSSFTLLRKTTATITQLMYFKSLPFTVLYYMCRPYHQRITLLIVIQDGYKR